MLSARQIHCLNGIGIRRWVIKQKSEQADKFVDLPDTKERDLTHFSAFNMPIASPEQEVVVEIKKEHALAETPLDTWDDILNSIHHCQSCALSQNCIQKVPGIGDRNADLMIIGEGPGHDEDIKGEPFVGRSGQLLDKMLAAIGIQRAQIFITNIVKCRPPNNRDPHVDEVESCNRYLMAQIKHINPRVILSVGRISAHSLLHTQEPVGRLIKSMHQLPGTDIPIKVTYHPAYLLRTPSAKAIAWQDMKMLYRLLNR